MADVWPLVGRDRERALIRAAIDSDGAGGVVLSGPPGTGKTRLALDARAIADANGWLTLHVTGSRAAANLPLAAMAPLVPPQVISGSDLPLLLSRAHDALAARAAERDLLIVVDDAHVLDDASALLAYQLAAMGTAFVVVTVRSGEPVPDPVTGLWKDGLAERIDLEPLDRADIEQLAALVLGGPVADATVRDLADRSAGNALYLRELITGAQQSGALTEHAGLWQLTQPLTTTPRLAELIRANLAGLSAEEHAAVELLAIGEPLGVAELTRAGSARALDRLERRGLVQVSADGRRLVARFGHPLYGDVVRSELPELRRRAVARALADLVARTGARRHDDALRMATWRVLAGDLDDPALLLRGARIALGRHDYPLARDLATAADTAGGGPRAQLLSAVAMNLIGSGPAAEAVLDGIELAGLDAALRFEVQLARLENLVYVQSRLPEAIPLIEAALADPTPCAARDEIEFYRYQLAFLIGDPTAEDGVAEIAERTSGGLRGVILGTHAMNLVNIGRFDRVASICDAARAELESSTDPMHWSSQGLDVFRCTALAESGHIAAAAEIATTSYQTCLATRQLDMQTWLGGTLSRIALLRGQVTEAVRWAGQATGMTAATGRTYFAARAHLDHALAQAAAGAEHLAMTAVETAAASGLGGPGFDAQVGEARGWALAAAGDLDGAKACFVDAAEAARTATYHGVELSCLHSLRRVGGRASDLRIDALAALVDGPLAAARVAHLRASDSSALLAVSHDFERLGAVLFAAEAAADAAVAERREGDTRTATAARLRAEALGAACAGAATPALRPIEIRHRLTTAELRVAGLAAKGMRSKEIAAELTVSVRTVDNTLQRVYVKLGIAGRGDLAAALEAESRLALQR